MLNKNLKSVGGVLGIILSVIMICWITSQSRLDGVFYEAGVGISSPLMLWAKMKLILFGLVCGSALSTQLLTSSRFRKICGFLKISVICGTFMGSVLVAYIRYPPIEPLLESYCRGFAFRLQRDIGIENLSARLRAIEKSDEINDELSLLKKGENIFPEISSNRPPVLWLFDDPRQSHKKILVASFKFGGGVVSICFGGETKNPNRFFDLNWHWINELWITIRQE